MFSPHDDAEGVACSVHTMTPKALANFSPGLERSDNPGWIGKLTIHPERVRQPPNPFRVSFIQKHCTQGSRFARTLGDREVNKINPERVSPTAKPFQGFVFIQNICTQGSRFARTLGDREVNK